jgi:hypothetical protein
MSFAPIALFTYNRLRHTIKTVEALQKNIYADQSDLIIYSDGPRSGVDIEHVNEVRKYLGQIIGFKSVRIFERERNYGLANNIIDGVTEIIHESERIIVLEDDLLTSPYFLKYMNEALALYEQHKNVLSIHGYIYPVQLPVPDTFFLIDPGSLGWGTWKDRWLDYERSGTKLLQQLERKKLISEFNYDNTFPFIKMLKDQIAGKNNSWVIRWYAHALYHRQLTLYPSKSLVFHNGSDGSGTHEGTSDILDVELTMDPISVRPIKIEISQEGREAFKDYFRRVNPGILKKIIRKLKKILLNGNKKLHQKLDQ